MRHKLCTIHDGCSRVAPDLTTKFPRDPKGTTKPVLRVSHAFQHGF